MLMWYHKHQGLKKIYITVSKFDMYVWQSFTYQLFLLEKVYGTNILVSFHFETFQVLYISHLLLAMTTMKTLFLCRVLQTMLFSKTSSKILTVKIWIRNRIYFCQTCICMQLSLEGLTWAGSLYNELKSSWTSQNLSQGELMHNTMDRGFHHTYWLL